MSVASPPVQGPTPPFGGAPPVGSPPEPPRRSRTGLIAAAVILTVALVSGAAGSVIGTALRWRQARRTFVVTPQSPAAPDVNPFAPTPSGGAPQTGTGSLAVSDIAKRVSPAVVDVTSTIEGDAAAGTGMVVTSSGEVLTNNHVIDGASGIRVQIDGTGPLRPATVLGYDQADDIALLKIDASGLKTIDLGKSSGLSVGQSVVAIGNAGGQSGPPTVTQGAITAVDRSLVASNPAGRPEQLDGMIEIDAPIEPGDSGGPLVDAAGKVIGINTAAARGFRMSASNVGFAVPIDTAMRIAHQIEAGKASSQVHIGPRGLLGIQVQEAGGFGSRFGSTSSGAVVAGVQGGSPAQGAGLSPGDVIVSVAGKGIGSASELTDAVGGYHPGDKVDLAWVDQAGRRHTATVTLVAGPPA